MAYTKQEIVDLVTELAEGRGIKLNLKAWLDLEISQIIQKKRFWWRRRLATFDSVVGTSEYDLSADGLDKADDLEQIISVYRLNAAGSADKIYFEGDEDRIQALLADSTQGEPTVYFPYPGAPLTLCLKMNPDAVATYQVTYWAGFNIHGDVSSDTIPLIPPTYHHVPLLALVRRVYLHLFGQNDPRFAVAEKDFQSALGDLMAFQAPSQESVTEFRTSDSNATVRSTN